MDILETQTNRKILFVVDKEGNTGKTELSIYMKVMKGAGLYQNGKSADLAMMCRMEKTVVFDLCRTNVDSMNWGIIENMKNGTVQSSKYESKMKLFVSPKMVVMMNEPPKTDALSADRYSYMYISEGGKYTVEGL